MGSDHNPVVGSRNKTQVRKKTKLKMMRRINIRKISKNAEIRGKVAREMAKALRQVDDNMGMAQSCERWKMAQKEV